MDVAVIYRAVMQGSVIRQSHCEGDDCVLDPHSLRCQPQVVGARVNQLREATEVLV